MATCTTVPGKPSSATTTLLPPASTSSGSPAASASRTASTTLVLGRAPRRAARPGRRGAASSARAAGSGASGLHGARGYAAAGGRQGPGARRGRTPRTGCAAPSLPSRPLARRGGPRRPRSRASLAPAGAVGLAAGFATRSLVARQAGHGHRRRRPRGRRDPRGADRRRARHDDAARARRTSCARRSSRSPSCAACATERGLPAPLRIAVNACEPVAAVVAGGRAVAVAGDGTLLRGTPPGRPARSSRASVRAGRRRGSASPSVRRAIALLAAAPAPLRARVAASTSGPRPGARRAQTGRSSTSAAPSGCAAKWVAAAGACSPTRPRAARRTSTCACPSGRSPAASSAAGPLSDPQAVEATRRQPGPRPELTLNLG